jgi:hypothetical protein
LGGIAVAVPERDAVDRAFSAAQSSLDEAQQSTGPTGNSSETIVHCARALVYALEGVMRQIRDLDDDLFAGQGKLESSLADLGTIINGIELIIPNGNQKKGIF